MAGEGSIEEDLNCPICLELLEQPVTLPECFHSFCKDCLQKSMEGARESMRFPYYCPTCRRKFRPDSASDVNHHLQNIVNNYITSKEKAKEESNSLPVQLRESVDNQSPSVEQPPNTELQGMAHFISIMDERVQTLLTALEQTSRRMATQPESDVQAQSETTVTITEQPPQSAVTSENSEYTRLHQTQRSDCDFRPDSLEECCEESSRLCKKHFVLIVFIAFVCLFILCFLLGVGMKLK